MKFLTLATTDPYRNLAIEEYLFSHADEEILMLWQNDPSVILGKNQSAYAEVDLDYAKKHGIRIVRRITGGGAVYHDAGNVNYTYVSPNADTSTLDFAGFSKPIIDALASLGVQAVLTGRNDLEVGGRKISGNAQYHRGGRTLHHGTILFDADLEVLSSVLRPDEEKIRSRAIRSVHARVCNLRSLLPQIDSARAFRDVLSAFIDKTYAPTRIPAPDHAEIDALTARNASSEWLFPKRELLSDYTALRKRRYPFGTVEVQLWMSEDRIKKAHVFGDFFSTAPIGELEELLCDASLASLPSVLKSANVGAYIFGMTPEELTSLLCEIE
jgi:lipoate-protein ligase A